LSALTQSSRPYNQGFSLVEIMVGMVIGLLGIIVIMQVFSVFEGQKRSTTGGDDAQNGGVIALNGLQREVSQAGYGINSAKLIACPMITPMISLPALAPVIINPQKGTAAAPITGLNPPVNAIPADANTDTLLITYGDSNAVAEGSLITGVDTVNLNYTISGGAAASGVAAVGVGGRGFQNGDFVFADSGSRAATAPVCTALYLTQANGVNTSNVPVQSIPAGFTYNAVTAKINNPTLYNLGPTPHMLAYAVINSTLSVCDFAGTSPQNCTIAPTAAAQNGWTQLATGIVSMKAVCVSPAGIRLALVARNSQYNPTPVTTAANLSWGGATAIVAATGTLGPNTQADEPWMHYRYKTFETIIPIRNAIWAGAKGC
jgi:type IV pilus assembly protein PilW